METGEAFDVYFRFGGFGRTNQNLGLPARHIFPCAASRNRSAFYCTFDALPGVLSTGSSAREGEFLDVVRRVRIVLGRRLLGLHTLLLDWYSNYTLSSVFLRMYQLGNSGSERTAL